MRNIFIIHGSYGHPEENWFPWLKKELEALGHNVIVPRFPIHSDSTNNHRLNEWIDEFGKYKNFVNDETIIVAHSRGCVFCYHILPTFKVPIDATFLVGPWDTFQWGDVRLESFHSKPFEWGAIRNKSKCIEVFQSTNDVIPVSEGQRIATNLHAKINIVKNAGHFNIATYKRFVKFPLLLEQIKKRLKVDFLL